jgi:hypothetical protein
MLAFGLFHLSTTETVVEGCGRNSAGSVFSGVAFDESRSESRRAAVMVRSSVLDSNPRTEREGVVKITRVIVTVFAGGMVAIDGDTATELSCLAV